ncbi:MAG TPA: PilZ domain-containing protein [Candidatus Acidoferrales bacterium]|jgi:DNA-binding response OmpR family regulator|nr:PilZ domain-containing protein [Candidatus Acidoferrales bacterium]
MLESLLLSRDAEVFRVLRATLEKLSIEIEVCQEAKKASDILISQKFDAVIVDCDDMPGGVGVLEGLRATPSNKNSVTFAIVNERTSTQEAFGMGVNFVLHKPLSVLNTSRCFNAALSFMLRERRRYFRHPVKMPVCLVLDGKEIKGESTNISEGGIALLLHQALPKNATPRLQFTLPASGPALDVDTEVAWADLKGYVGLRFLNLPASSQELLEGWLTTQMERQTSGPKDILAAPTPPAIQ